MKTTPNIILIYADDLGRGMLSCYGQKLITTPNIDRLASEGMRLTQAYGCAFCAPARASLLCGVHDAHAGRWTFNKAGVYMELDKGNMSLEQIYELIHNTGIQGGPEDVYLPQIAKQAGYVTGQIGKLEWGFATTGDELARHGWDYHYGDYDHQRCHGYYPTFLFENGKAVPIDGNTYVNCGARRSAFENGERIDMTGRKVYSQDLYDRKIVEFIRQNKDRPFFLYHPSQLPHGPVFYPQIHPSVKEHPELTDIEKEYASMVLRLDQTVGTILDELDALDLAQQTIIIFCSDNGHTLAYSQPSRVSGQVMLNGTPIDNVHTKFHSDTCGDIFDGNNGMAGLKLTSWEGGVKIPYLIRWPGHINPHTVSDRLIANYDLMPTFAELLGQPMPPNKDGVSFASIWTSEGCRAAEEHEYIVYSSYLGPAIISRDGWKLRCVVNMDKYKIGPFGAFLEQMDEAIDYQLYQITTDYREEQNVAAHYPYKVSELRQKLIKECDGNLLNGTPQAHFAFYGMPV
ncbi:sulfatase-like hydrolase/transferase [Paenibacillus filicis]|uniref:Sulfatase-like hydrolase/transferase n=1 Tax=Paenibacillus gyeongsangnamensis TaxID=3388067 RepID=A0ABT4Q4C5_9BACL|nr:sulfatase-like hydrolase/transferase [Paenibacillus filicis]MCZ8511713.1 sulfatase-like hydrolase/transferase [Paenibacillus filicis]